MNNQDQIEYWNGRAGQNWAKQQDYTDQILGHITEAFLPFAAAKPGESVLDIGCGCGTTTFSFAQCVGREGSVAGVDISGPMLAVAQARARRHRSRRGHSCSSKPMQRPMISSPYSISSRRASV